MSTIFLTIRFGRKNFSTIIDRVQVGTKMAAARLSINHSLLQRPLCGEVPSAFFVLVVFCECPWPPRPFYFATHDHLGGKKKTIQSINLLQSS